MSGSILRLFCSVRLAIALAVFVGGAMQPLCAQLTRGYISGTVTDPSGGVIVKALVKITSTATNEEREMETNPVGVYRFVAIEPGAYGVEFSFPGFENKKLDNVRVGPAEEVVLNKTLKLAGGTTTIEVPETLPVPGLAKTTPTVGKDLGEDAIQWIPISAATREVTQLALLTPTISRGPAFGEISSNGQRTRQNNFLIDGTDNNELTVTGASARLIPEAVADLQIQTSAYSAEYGRDTGAQVSVLTRSARNVLHGEVWEYYRGNWMEPVSLRNKRSGFQETSRFVQNQVGGSIGGPVRKDYTFLFGILEANRRRESPDTRNAQTARIPTPKGYAALSDVPLAAGQTPAGRQAVLDALAFLPEIHRLVSNYDNRADQIVNGRPIEMGTILIPLAQSYNYWYGLVRFDHHLMDRTNLTYRYLLDKRSVANSASNRQFGSRFAAASELFSQNHALSLTHAFSPRSMNEFRFAYIRNNVGFLENDPTNPTVQILNLFTIGGTSTFPAGRISNTFQWQDVTTTLHGRHSLKFGIDIRRNRLFNNAAFDSKGTWTFSNFVDFVNNRASNLRQSLLDASYDARQTNQSYFFQDDIRVKRNLNLNLGFRYEYSGVPFGFFGAANAEIAAAGVPLPAKPDRNNFAPRFGIAYSPTPREGWKNWLFGDGNTTFRAGFGVGYDVLFYNILTVTASNYPRVVKSDTVPSQNLFPTLAPKQTNIPPFDPLKTPLTSFTNASTDIQNPTTQFWSFSIQRQIRENYLLEIGYAGNRSYHLLRLGERNPGILTEEQVKTGKIPALQDRRLSPAWGARTTIESTALSEYHALFIRADRRMLSGLLFGASYAWSANFSDNDEPLGIGDIVLSSPWVPQDSFNYRNEWSRSVFDRPHRFVVHYSYEIPWLRSAGGYSPLLKHLFAGWRASGFTEWQSGQPFTVRTGVDSGGSGIPIGWRPDYNPNGIFEKDPVEGNLRTFKAPIAGGGIFVTPLTAGKLPLVNSMPRGGNLGRNTFRGPSYTMWNFSLAKQVAVSERVNLQLRADWFNLWNHHNFGNPVATMNSGADFGTNTTDPGGRTMLLNMKVSF